MYRNRIFWPRGLTGERRTRPVAHRAINLSEASDATPRLFYIRWLVWDLARERMGGKRGAAAGFEYALVGARTLFLKVRVFRACVSVSVEKVAHVGCKKFIPSPPSSYTVMCAVGRV